MPVDGTLTGKELLNVQEEIKQSNELLKEFLATYVQLKKEASAFNSVSGANKIIKERSELDNKVNAELKERNRLLKALAAQEAKNNQITSETSVALAKQRLETQRANKANKENAILTSRFSTAYEKLSVRLNKARRNLKDLVITQGENAKATRRAAIEVQNLDGKLKRADAISGQFQRNVGNYPSVLKPAIGTLRQLAGAFGAIEGIRIGLDITKESIALAREAKGVEFAFRRLGTVGLKAFEDVKRSTRGLLSELDIQRSLVELDNFNINLEQAGVLFEFLTVRSLQTGQSIDKLKDSLVEGLSKESLLRIDNLGISAKELNQQLQLTPNFVEAVAIIAKREVTEAGAIIDKAGSSQRRFNKSIENTKKSFGQLLQSNGLGFFGTLSSRIDKIDKGIKAFNTSLVNVRTGLDNFLSPIKRLLESFPTLNRFLKENIQIIGNFFNIITTPGITVFADALTRLGAVLSGLGNAFVASKDEAINFVKTLARFGDIDFSLNPIENFKNIKTFFAEAGTEFVQGGKNVAEAFNKGYEDALKVDVVKDQIKELDLSLSDPDPDPKKVVEGSIAAYESVIEELKKLQKETATTTEEYNEYENQIAAVEKKISELKNGIDALNKVQNIESRGIISTTIASEEIDTSSAEDAQKAITQKALEEKRKERAILKSIEEGKISDFKAFREEELKILEDALELQFNLQKDNQLATEDLIIGGLDSIFQARIQNIDKELIANQDKLNLILSSTTATEEQKALAQKKFDQEEVKLLKKRQRRENQAFLVQQGIGIATIAIDLAKNLAAINAAAAAMDLITPFALGATGAAYRATNIPLAIGTAAAQTGLIIAQTIPQFFKGKKATDSFEGLATWGERRREVLVDKQGNITVSPNKTTPLYVQKDDIIVPSMSTFDKQLKDPESDVSQRLARRLDTDTKERVRFIQTQSASIDTQGIEKVMERVMMKYANRPVNATVKLEQPDNYTQY